MTEKYPPLFSPGKIGSLRIPNRVCTGCGVCADYCSFGAVELRDGAPVFNAGCVLCGACANACPASAITLDRRVREADLSRFSGVFAYVETACGAADRSVGPARVAVLPTSSETTGSPQPETRYEYATEFE